MCGHRSFVASGFEKLLESNGVEYDLFSRGGEGRQGNVVLGDVMRMSDNQCLDTYDTVVNFIILKDQSIEENLKYMKSLVAFCKKAGVRHLIQISSISVYSSSLEYVDETTPIDPNGELKGSYGSLKVAVDKYLQSEQWPFDVVFVRPGFIVSDERALSMAGIVKNLPLLGGILLGDRNTSLPLVEKKQIHEALIRIICAEKKQPIYLLLENNKGTKYQFAKKYYKKHVFCLPKKLTLVATRILRTLNIFSDRQVEQVKGLFKSTYFDSSETEYQLQMSFAKDSIAVLGAGTYGSYVIDTLKRAERNSNITLFDVGDESLRNEEEIGYGTNLLGSIYTGLRKGRFFGYGGASGKWGGQLLMFTEKDFSSPSNFMRGIIDLDKKYRDAVFARFRIKNSFEENDLGDSLFSKTGVWLGYFNRNMFNYFKIKKSSVFIRNHIRVKRLLLNDDKSKIVGLEYVTKTGNVKHAYYDQYFLTAGAFECNRIVLSSNMVDSNSISFSDHLSQRIFQVKGRPIIKGENFQFGLQRTSMITKRIIGEVNGVSFFANPIFNDEFPFFQNLKKILFKNEVSMSVILAVFRDIPSVIAFVWNMVFLHRIYIYKNQWKMFIDIENPSKNCKISLSKDLDQWGVPKLNVSFEVPQEAVDVFSAAKERIGNLLTESGVTFESDSKVISAEKAEDTYHPYGMFLSDSESVEAYFNRYDNLLVVNTGVLPRAGGINTTASCFPLIEEYIAKKYDTK